MLKFRYTCVPHRHWFIEVAERAGCSDPAKMEEVRRALQAWFSQQYPRLMLDHFRDETCLACDFQARFGNLNEVGRAIRELVNEVTGARGRATVTGRTSGTDTQQ